MQQKKLDEICELIEGLGAFKVGYAPIGDVVFDKGYRKLCESNSCGKYGTNWMCPPDAGDIDELINRAKSFETIVVYQTVGQLEDSYDFEGMMAQAKEQSKLYLKVRNLDILNDGRRILHLGAGGCHVCESCTKPQNQPCRYPDTAIASLETYGIEVSSLAKSTGMKYINGQDTVTYFGAILL